MSEKFNPIKDIELNLESLDITQITAKIENFIIDTENQEIDKYFFKELNKKRLLQLIDIKDFKNIKFISPTFYEVAGGNGYYITFSMSGKLECFLGYETYSEIIVNGVDGPELELNASLETDLFVFDSLVGIECKFTNGEYNDLNVTDFRIKVNRE